MAMLHGTVGEFDIKRKDWTAYAKWLQQYFAANDIVNSEKKRAVLLSVYGPSTYKPIRNLVSPSKPSNYSLDELLDTVHKHYKPRPSIVVH